MPSELHCQPDRLRAHAITAAVFAEDLRGVLPAPSPGMPGGRAFVAEHERVREAVLVVVRELSELSAALAGAAGAAAAADDAVTSSMRRILDQLDTGL
jgi:hypothetical protein